MTNAERKNLINQYRKAHNSMMNAWSESECFDYYCEACDCKQALNPGECGMKDCDRCWLTREYNDICREIRRRPQGNVTVNLWGCDITIKTK